MSAITIKLISIYCLLVHFRIEYPINIVPLAYVIVKVSCYGEICWIYVFLWSLWFRNKSFEDVQFSLFLATFAIFVWYSERDGCVVNTYIFLSRKLLSQWHLNKMTETLIIQTTQPSNIHNQKSKVRVSVRNRTTLRIQDTSNNKSKPRASEECFRMTNEKIFLQLRT